MTLVKVCGITNHEDAEAAVAAGADGIGFIFASSPRQVDVPTVRSIVKKIPLFSVTVGVFVNEAPERICAVMSECGLSVAQLHGDEPSGDVAAIGSARVIKALRIKDSDSLSLMNAYDASVFLIEPYVPGKPGGTGQVLDRELARQAIASGHRIILAGGLTPENVYGIVFELRPYAVDVGSGVEKAPGRKDHKKLRDFVSAVREADCALLGS